MNNPRYYTRPLCAVAPLCARSAAPLCTGWYGRMPWRPMCGGGNPGMWNAGGMQKLMQAYQMYQMYQPKPVEKPIEKPNVIRISEPKIASPTRPPREALRILLDSIRPGFTESGNLFDQGLTSYNVMQMVTRAGEHGYRLTMRDILAEPTFDAIASKMKAGE